MTLVLRYAARSDRGLVRSSNQDSVYAGPRLLALADGMGGHAAGEVASKVVIAALAPLDDDEPGDDLLTQLGDSVVTGNSAIAEAVENDSELEGMGTTLTAILFSQSKLGLAHVGDSRAYLSRAGQFAQITHDDTFVQKLQDEGRITAEEAENHPQRALLLKALTGQEVEPNLTVREARAGDRFLLCSDGLSGMVSHETLAEAITITDPQDCADRMIELALKGGGTDNITVIVADVVDVEFGENAPIVGGAAGDGSDMGGRGDSPAARAQALTAPPPQQQQAQAPQPPPADQQNTRRKGLTYAALSLLVLVLIVAAAFTTRYFVLQQYYVSIDDSNEVAIYQGITGSILGMDLNTRSETSCIAGDALCERLFLGDLEENARVQLCKGVEQDDLDEARNYIATLRAQQVLDERPGPEERQEVSCQLYDTAGGDS